MSHGDMFSLKYAAGMIPISSRDQDESDSPNLPQHSVTRS
jgi:hypothetical protein